ncbi:MAG: DUF362 domain-containing protein [Candidatus Eremiobacteraeota bacterium]|nr:DUF362 domain-containing protein [Candidatus Eremiobacteraeota bacterium]
MTCTGKRVPMAKVHFLESHPTRNRILGIKRLIAESGVLSSLSRGDVVAVKFHPGELGNPYHVDSLTLRIVLDAIKERGGDPFLMDTTALYLCTRATGLGYYRTVNLQGFSLSTTGAPFICGDGLGGSRGILLKGKGIAEEILMADILAECQFLFVVSHCKGHRMTGFGGAVKNVGMGCVTRQTKLSLHRKVSSTFESGKCNGCGRCNEECPWHFPQVVDGRMVNTSPFCMRCTICMDYCPEGAIALVGIENLGKAIASSACAVVERFGEKKAFLNVAMNISAHCDCIEAPGRLVMGDIGYFASHDLVACDQAFLAGERASVFQDLYGIDPRLHVSEAERLGGGTTDFELIRIEP